MQAYDILMLIVLGLAIIWGAWKGLAWQIASILSLGLSYIVALHFRMPLANIINASPPWNIFLSMLILFLGTGLVVWIGFNLISEIIERVKLKEFDRQLGAIFGAAKGVILCVLITLFSVALLGDDQRRAICSSKSGYYIAVLLDRTDTMIPRELHQVLGPYLDRLDREIPHEHTVGQAVQLPPAWTDAEMPVRSAGQKTPAWQQELEAVFSGKTAPPAQPPAAQPPTAPPTQPPAAQPSVAQPPPTHPSSSGSFPIGAFQSRSEPSFSSQPSAGRIEAQPVPPQPAGGLRR
jgi:membrane protein required for colicin V production